MKNAIRVKRGRSELYITDPSASPAKQIQSIKKLIGKRKKAK